MTARGLALALGLGACAPVTQGDPLAVYDDPLRAPHASTSDEMQGVVTPDGGADASASDGAVGSTSSPPSGAWCATQKGFCLDFEGRSPPATTSLAGGGAIGIASGVLEASVPAGGGASAATMAWNVSAFAGSVTLRFSFASDASGASATIAALDFGAYALEARVALGAIALAWHDASGGETNLGTAELGAIAAGVWTTIVVRVDASGVRAADGTRLLGAPAILGPSLGLVLGVVDGGSSSAAHVRFDDVDIVTTK